MAQINNLQFRKLRDSEFDQAHVIICEAVEWLLSRNIRQWTVPLPRHIYRGWQEKGQNHALICNGALAVILSLVKETSRHWLDKTGAQPCWWLSTAATSREFSGQRLGQKAIEEAKIYLAELGVEEIYLDCVYGDGFLPKYYESLGFESLARKTIQYPVGSFNMCLMKCLLDKPS